MFFFSVDIQNISSFHFQKAEIFTPPSLVPMDVDNIPSSLPWMK